MIIENYGGIFTNKPFELNPTCIIFGFILMLFYWVISSEKNPFMLPFLFIIAYIAMAWYDWLYNCSVKMYTGRGAISPIGIIDSVFKPQRRSETQIHERDQELLPNQEQVYLKTVYLFHLIAVMPLLAYIGWNGAASDKRVFPIILGISILVGLYHGFRLFFVPRETMN